MKSSSGSSAIDAPSCSGVLPGEAKTTAEATIAELDQLLTELGDIAGSQDVERFDIGVGMGWTQRPG